MPFVVKPMSILASAPVPVEMLGATPVAPAVIERPLIDVAVSFSSSIS